MTRVLLADDDDLLAALLQVKLEAQGFQVCIAHDGPSTLAAALADPPDVIVLDAMMPGCDGFEVADKIKHHAALGSVPIVMLTARRNRDDVIKAMNAGVRDYVVKPFRVEELVARVRRVLAEQDGPVQATS